jgi:hypothetical protein
MLDTVFLHLEAHLRLGVVVHTCNPSYQEAEIGGSGFEASQGKKCETLSEK